MLTTSTPVMIIPAFEPDEQLLQLINGLLAHDAARRVRRIIIVDDGSSAAAQNIFKAVAALPQVTLLRHVKNLGKGQALKTAFNYYLLHDADTTAGVVTADADGQHCVADIYKIADHFSESPAALWLGAREHGADGRVPWRSRFGNRLTRQVFRWVTGKLLRDTQTGLRAIPAALLPALLQISAARYEYELEMLLYAIRAQVVIRELPIQKIYIDNNKRSHFNPLRDSLRIYAVFLRYLWS